jgi:hypothetical protein
VANPPISSGLIDFVFDLPQMNTSAIRNTTNIINSYYSLLNTLM